jgi:Prp18 domain
MQAKLKSLISKPATKQESTSSTTLSKKSSADLRIAKLENELNSKRRKLSDPVVPETSLAIESSVVSKPSSPLDPNAEKLHDWIDRSLETWKSETPSDEKFEETSKVLSAIEFDRIPNDIVVSLLEITHLMDKKEFKSANDRYLLLAVGNQAWPVGTKGLQVKVRSCNDRIGPSTHILNSENNRIILQSFKRLLNFVTNHSS